MDEEIYTKIAVPLMMIGRARLIGITTLSEAEQHFSNDLFDAVHPITCEPLADTYSQPLICSRCAKLKHPEKCRHMLKFLSPWMNRDAFDVVKAMYGRGKATVFSREILAVNMQGSGKVFRAELIRAFERAPPFVPTPAQAARTIIVTCDPNGGGINECGIISAVYISGVQVIVGIEAGAQYGDDDDFVALFRDHIIGLRSHPWLARADIVFIGECNGNYNVGLLVQAVSDVERFMPVRQKPGGKYGWTTTKVNKIEYSNSQRLQFGYGSVRFLHNAVCTNRAEPAASRLEETKAKLIAQLREYRPVPTKPKTAHASSSITHSGKTDEDGNIVSGKNDDLVIALCMNAHMWQKAKQRELPCVNYDRLAVALAAS